MEPLRLGILGAARITDLAIIKPAKITGTRLVAVAARDPARTDAADAVRTMRLIDQCYEAVGLQPRPTDRGDHR